MSRPASALECFAGSVVPDGWWIDAALYAQLAQVLNEWEELRELEALSARLENEHTGEIEFEESSQTWEA